MTKRYELSAVAADGQDTSIGILVDDANLREWLSHVRGRTVTENFRFQWSDNPRAIMFPFRGMFAAVYRRDGIHIEGRLFYEDRYQDGLYSLDELCRMLFKGIRRIRPSSLGWCVAVKVC